MTTTDAARRASGFAAAVVLAAVAWPVSALSPLLGPAVVAAFLGVAVAWSLPSLAVVLRPGALRSAKLVLQVAIVLLGATLAPQQLAIGWSAAAVVLVAVVVALAAVALLHRPFAVDRETATLLAAGTSICGATAVAVTSGVIRARSAAVTAALATVLLLNLVGVLVFPVLGRALGMTQEAFGVWAATAVHDTSSVLAAATAYGPQAADVAVVVKLARTLLLIPFVLAVGVWFRRGEAAGSPGVRRLVPPFLVVFVAAVALNGVGVVPDVVQPGLRTAATAGIGVALAAFGLTADRASVQAAGPRAVAVGAGAWVAVSVAALVLIRVTGVG